MNPRLRAVVYARVSTRERQEALNQLEQLRIFVKSQGWQSAGEYVDKESGSTSDRAAFQKLFEHASRRKFDIVLFWALDRFSREGALKTLNHLNRLTSYGVEFRSFTEQYLDSCGVFKDALISILAVIAKQERIRISERTKAGMERAAAAGRSPGRPRADHLLMRELADQGMPAAAIAEQLGASRVTVWRALR